MRPPDDLLPCPFCGGEASIETTEGSMGEARYTVGCNDGGGHFTAAIRKA